MTNRTEKTEDKKIRKAGKQNIEKLKLYLQKQNDIKSDNRAF